MNILIADSSPLYHRILLEGFGEGLGVSLHYVDSSAAALKFALENDVQFYILAGQLPDGDGLALARELRKTHAASFEPIVLLTGSPSAELAQQASQAGVTELFRKQDVGELITFMRFYIDLFGPVSCRTLYVEDARDQRLVLTEQMREWGMTVDAFASAEEAWQALQESEYDLAVCDVVLGTGMSGARLINRIRRQPGRLGSMPILAVTAFDNPNRRIELFHFGINDYISKPFVPIELKARINTLLARQQAVDAAQEAAERTSRLKSEFLANMSHEIRTPMNAILGMISLARRRIDDAGAQSQLDKAKNAADHLLSIINDILDLSKIEADRLELEQINFMIGEVMENVTSILGHKAVEKGLSLHVDLAPEMSQLSVQGDPLRIGQILINLVGNAIKFTSEGSITVRLQQDTSVPEADGKLRLRCEVIDTGIGIDQGDVERLFDAFQQADGSMSRKYGGTGLGLSICKRLVQMMGGEIGVKSLPGAGSTFWFTLLLPRATGTAVAASPAFTSERAEARLKDECSGMHVLLVEDEPFNQEVSTVLLEDAGLIISIANDGAEALSMAKAQVYDMILMDLQMPKMNGIDATRAIRADSLNITTPILAMTANAFDEDKRACSEAGMNDHISKPVDPDILYETILRWSPKAKRPA